MNARTLVIIIAAACHGPAIPAAPGQGGPAWVELQSEHFTLWTDTSASRAHRLIREMEHLRQVVLGVGLSNGNADGRSFVIALRDGEEVGAFIPPQFVAFAFGEGGPLRQPMILIPGDTTEKERPIITHELTHVISYTIIHHQPRWFAEGLANVFATVNIDPDHASGDFGKPLDHVVARVKQHPPTRAAAMFACTQLDCMDEMFYATAWAMFAFLANTHPTELLRYADRLDELPDGSGNQAWAEVFPDLPPAKLDSELRKWLAYGKHTVWKFNVKLQDWPVTERKLGDGDVYAARGLLRYMLAQDKPEVPVEITSALAADPTNVVAHMVVAAVTKTVSIEDARRVASAHPDDWRAWYLVGLAVDWKGEEARDAHDKTCALMVTAHVTPPPSWCSQS